VFVICSAQLYLSDIKLDSDIVFVIIVRNSDQFPGGYHLLVASNMLDGVLGGRVVLLLALSWRFVSRIRSCFVGFSTAIATSHAYVSDCVAPTER
jgi:hypothetical protein